MAYRDNVSALAAKLGISNDPGLREEDLKVAELRFTDGQGNVLTTIQGTPMNMGGRLFFQAAGTLTLIDEDRYASLRIDDLFREQAARHFAELWEPNPEPGKRALLDAIRDPRHVEVEIGWKY
jgi:hypothetical protein